jgi:hypothetical protein
MNPRLGAREPPTQTCQQAWTKKGRDRESDRGRKGKRERERERERETDSLTKHPNSPTASTGRLDR